MKKGDTGKRAGHEAMMDLDSGDEDLLLVKRRDDQINIDELKSDPWKTSKNQLKKIKKDGLYGGRNIKDLDDDTGILFFS